MNSDLKMVLAGQRVQVDRYSVIPRTLSFLFRGEEILLLKLRSDRGAWSGLHNGLGGHIEKGEDPLSSARREITEETGLEPLNLSLAGVVLIDTGSVPGIGLYVFIGSVPDEELSSSEEGQLEWFPLSELETLPLVSDLTILIPAALESKKRGRPFSAITTFNQDGNPEIHLRYD